MGADTGFTPRFIDLDPTGRLLYAANEAGDTVVTFAVEASTGKLASTGQSVKMEAPSRSPSQVHPKRAVADAERP